MNKCIKYLSKEQNNANTWSTLKSLSTQHKALFTKYLI